MDTKQVKLTHVMVQKLSIKLLSEVYNQLNVKADNYDPESWYGGCPHPITGQILANGQYIKGIIFDLFSSIAKSKPICKEKYKDTWIVWPKGNGMPTYSHCQNGISWLSSKEYDCYHSKKDKLNHHCKKSKGKFLSSGKYGLGVLYNTACIFWGKKIIDNLPEKT